MRTIFALIWLMHAAFAGYSVQYFTIEDETKSIQAFMNEHIEDVGFTLQERSLERFETLMTSKTSPWERLEVFSLSADEALREALLVEANLGAFATMQLALYKKTHDAFTTVAHLRTKEVLDMANVRDAQVRKQFTKLFDPFDRSFKKATQAKKHSLEYEKISAHAMHLFSVTFDREQELALFIEQFQEHFEQALESQGLMMTGYKNFVQTYKLTNTAFERYDTYFTYTFMEKSTFKTLISKAQRADVMTLMPTSVVMYVQKGHNVLHIALPKMQAIGEVLNLTHETAKKRLAVLDEKLVTLFKTLNAVHKIPPEITWDSSYEAALKRAKKSNKPLFIFMNQLGCGSCAYMKEQVFVQTDVVDKLTQEFIPVSLNIHLNDAPTALQTPVTPVLHFVNPNGTLYAPTVTGGKNAQGLIELLESMSKSK